MMRALRGANVVPVVELSAKPMKTKFGMKQRPHFKIIDWRELGASQVASATPPPAIEHVGSPIKSVSTEQVLDDSIPF